MGFLQRLFGGAKSAPTDQALHIYVRCGRCGALVHVRVHLQNDLMVEYGDDDVIGYRLHKEMMDAKCFRLMYTDISFDRNRRELSRSIEGGEFITRDVYERLIAGQQEQP